MSRRFGLLVLLAGVLSAMTGTQAQAQRPAGDAATFAAYVGTGYRVIPNITYMTASGMELKLDFYRPAQASGPLPTAIFMYKKHHWQVAGPTFYQLHLLFDEHYKKQNDLVDAIAERIQMLGGISVAMSHDVAGMTLIPRPAARRSKKPWTRGPASWRSITASRSAKAKKATIS